MWFDVVSNNFPTLEHSPSCDWDFFCFFMLLQRKDKDKKMFPSHKRTNQYKNIKLTTRLVISRHQLQNFFCFLFSTINKIVNPPLRFISYFFITSLQIVNSLFGGMLSKGYCGWVVISFFDGMFTRCLATLIYEFIFQWMFIICWYCELWVHILMECFIWC